MANFHKEFSDYVTCTICGMKKYCKQEDKRFVCFACANGNFAKTWKIK